MPTDDPQAIEFEEKFGGWLEESVGISRKLVASLRSDDDWTFVIKMHGILEAGLNHLLLTRLGGNPSLAKTISLLETNNRRTGKIAFIKAYELLSDDACLFVQVLSEVRNRAVHDVKNFDLNLIEHVQSLDANQRERWKKAMCSWFTSAPPETTRNITLSHPREAIQNSCMVIMIKCLEQQREAALREFVKKAAQDYLQAEKRAESTSTES